jgi:ribose-phosphate pyrophosphokinase
MQTIILKDFECDAVAEHILYPDGQRSLRLDLSNLDVKELVAIKCRITSFAALEYLLCLVSALRKHDFYIYRLEIIYLLGMRSDRAFNPGEPNYFRDVVSNIINSLNIESIGIFSPHSDLSLKAINNASLLDIYHITNKKIEGVIIGGDQHTNNIDFGAKIGHFTKYRKGRDNIVVTLDDESKHYIKSELEKINHAIIVDDLCDAGGTFIADAKCFKEHFPNTPLDLFVAHGLFTNGINTLLEYFDHIYCTNSYQDLFIPRITQFKVI